MCVNKWKSNDETVRIESVHWESFGLYCRVLSVQRKRAQQRVRRIDRSMISSPTNFQHTGHIGSGDVDMGNSHLRAIQNQMQSKGGYETAFTTVKVNLKIACFVSV